ncbi:histone-like nucleoid-structuring protein Lsr2 [Nocardioides jejuensis]|uniref:Lsr2 family protein n=1 Tax=Nocardioides jejuensis TaxID=2502782 RepID=A0A4R1BTN7_9ACTN|nr:Lsr2 family protein [Nocardioides jejuensis]TCJ21061.1 Lsr2 family protein [Nocardioides jejuensis]
MAQKVSIVLIDDIDGGDADETVSFALDGTSYEIDLASANAARLREALAPYVGHARKVAGGRRTAAKKAGASGGTREVREWARSNGWPDLGDRGRVPADVQTAYDAAH